jgi:hypothetical protein
VLAGAARASVENRTRDQAAQGGHGVIAPHSLAGEPQERHPADPAAGVRARPIVWAATAPHLFFEADEPQQVQILKCVGVSYIAVHPTRRCDAVVPGTTPTAYPRTWLRTLPGRPYLERVYPMGDVGDTEGRFLLYRIDYAKVPPDWLTSPDLKQAGAC